MSKLYDIINKRSPRVAKTLYFLTHYKLYIEGESFYPEKERKSKCSIFVDFLCHVIKYGDLDDSYFVLGADVKGVNFDDYITYSQYMERRDRLNLVQPVNYVCLLRNKSLFSIVGEKWGFPVVGELARIVNGEIKDSQWNSILDLIHHHPHLFVKPINGQKGEGIIEIDVQDDVFYCNAERKSCQEVIAQINGLSRLNELIVQKKIVQHHLLSVLHKQSVNTLRVVTINNLHTSEPSDVVLVGSELRVGCGDNCTDNISAGGLKIGVKDGCLDKYGFYGKHLGTKTMIHPDSNIIFEGYRLPYYDESIELCKSFHAKLKEIHLIAWDVAITEEGPVLIEGNDSCGTDFQVLYGPMKDFYNKYLPE